MSPQELFNEARRLEDEGEFQPALSAWHQLAATNPTRNVFLRLAGLTKELGLLDDAEQAFKRALEIDPRSAIALKGLGILAGDRRDHEAAEGYLRRACQIEDDPGGLSLLGVALIRRGKCLEAEEAYRRAIGIDPTYEEAYYNLGVLLKHDRPSEAQMLFRRALELDPFWACAYRELGYVLVKRGAHREAEGHLLKAVELDPNDAWAHIYLGTCVWLRADVESALAEFHAAEKLEPKSPVPLRSLGNVYESVYEDFDLAQSYFEGALKLDPEDGEALKNLGRLFKKRGRLDLAREYLDRALRRHPGDKRAQALLSDLDGGRPA